MTPSQFRIRTTFDYQREMTAPGRIAETGERRPNGMTTYEPDLGNAELLDWSEISNRFDARPILLLGNGGSLAVWEGFSYRSLFGIARNDVAHPLDERDEELFAAFGGTDFEEVLGALLTAKRVGNALGITTTEVVDRYRAIQHALEEAVGFSHLTWDQLSDQQRAHLRTEYRNYQSIYTTNYDLILYWAMMQTDPGGDFVDFFSGYPLIFDKRRSPHIGDATAVLYLHGAIHLRRTEHGVTRKEVAGEPGNLLTQFGFPIQQRETPLMVSEGTSTEKLRRILSSDYLSFALERLETDSAPLVIFGQRLGGQDDHISRAVRQHRQRLVAIAIHASGDTASSLKLEFARRVAGSQILFFDAASHPLGDSSLKVTA